MGLLQKQEDNTSDPILTRMVDEDKVIWYKKPNLRSLYFLLFPTCMGIEITSGFDSQIINAVQIIEPWKKFFGQPQGALKGILAASYSLGAILSLPFVPMFNQRFGRRWSIMFGSVVMVLGSILQGFSNGIAMYIVARMMLGFGIPFCIISGSAMIGELGYPKERPILTSLFNSSYFIGQITAAAISLRTTELKSDWGWRIPSLLQMAPSLVQIGLVMLLPESPRYLISKDRSEEAFEILVKYHAEGDRDSLFVKAEMAQIQSTIQIELESSKLSWMDMFRTAGMRRRVFIVAFLGLFTQWSGNTLISYYLSDILDMVGIKKAGTKARINVGTACWALVCGTVFALVVPRFKRRTAYLACACSCLVVYIGWTISMERYLNTKSSAAAKLTIFWIFAYSPAYNLAYNALTYTYLVELFPYAERSRGIAIFQLFGRGAGFFTTFVNPIGLKNIQWKWLLTYCCWLAFELVFIWFFFPETSGRTLEELTFLFEGNENSDRVTANVEKQIHHGIKEDSNTVQVETQETLPAKSKV